MCPFNGKTHQIAVVTTAVASGEELWGGARGREKRSERRGEGWEKTRLRSKKDGRKKAGQKGSNCNCNCSILGRMKLGYLNVMSSIYLPRGGKCKGQRSLGF